MTTTTIRRGPATHEPPAPGRLRLGDLIRLSGVGLRTRKLRAGLSALGIAIGVGSVVAVLGLSSSSQAGLLAEISKLGTNLLTVSPGARIGGGDAELSDAAPAMIRRIAGVTGVEDVGEVADYNVYRNPHIPAVNTNGLSVNASSLNLPTAVSTSVVQGRYLNAATAQQPVAVLGSAAAQYLGMDRVLPGARIWVVRNGSAGQWFYVSGILKEAPLSPTVDASVFIGYPAAEKYLGFKGHPSTIYVRTAKDQVTQVYDKLAATANPENPQEVNLSQPSAALSAQAAAESAFNSLFLGLGVVALLIGAIGVANIMVISVLERRSEIGLRRALGATKGHIRIQFLSEAIVLSLIGGVVGVLLGALATAIYATANHWTIVIPPEAWVGGLGAALLIGALAGLLPALRAARMSPTEALRT
jgi:putative ABC transport system permease protein